MAGSAAKNTEITVLTEHWPPFQIAHKNLPLDGLSVRIVRALLDKVELETDIQVIPWARAYDMALKQPNILIFSMLRSPQRQNKFKWVGDIVKQQLYFFALSDRHDIRITTIEDAKNYVTGVSRRSFAQQLLLKYDFSIYDNLVINGTEQPLVGMLEKRRIDLLVGTEVTFLALKKRLKNSTSTLKMAYKVEEPAINISIAFSKKTDNKTVAHFKQAFAMLKQEDRYQQLVKRWLE